MESSQSQLTSCLSGTTTQVCHWNLQKPYLIACLAEPEKWTDEELGIPPDDE